MSPPLSTELETATRLAMEAGEMIRTELIRPDGPRGADETAVIDGEIEAFLRTALLERFPLSGFQAEERPDLNRAPIDEASGLWLVDPHDGTSAFLSGQRGASISIALIRHGRPVLGIIYAYAYPNAPGDLITWAEGCGPILRNGQTVDPFHVPEQLDGSHVVAVSRSADRRSTAYAQALAPARFIPMPGIAYRLALVAVGDTAAAISLSAPRDFDCAAGHALLIGAGADLYDERCRPVVYGSTNPQVAGFCFAGSKTVCKALAEQNWADCLRGPVEYIDKYPLRRPSSQFIAKNHQILDRAQGAWLGQLVGDALGSQAEFASPQRIVERWPEGVRAMEGGGPFNTAPGQITDDSELARHLACSLLDDAGFDPDSVAQAYRHWFESRPYDIGATTAQALSAISEEQPAASARASAREDSQANGALMRISALGIFGHSWPLSSLQECAAQDAQLTHPHAVCLDANRVFVTAMALAIEHGLSGTELYARVATEIQNLALETPIREAFHAAKTCVPTSYTEQQGWVLIAFQNAFHQLAQGRTYEEALVDTISRGGDTDTNACIVGALLGSAQGLGAIPAQWIQAVLTCRPIAGVSGIENPRPRSCWSVDALLMAEHLVVGGTQCA